MSRKLFQYDPVIGYRFVPGLKARVDHEGVGYLVRVNGAGFRWEHEFVPQEPAGVFRVLVFGDSFTAGDGVSNKDRYTDVLERLIEGVEVYNFGLSGTGTDQQYLAYREIGRTLEHDLVIMAGQIENIRRVGARYRAVADEQGQIVHDPLADLQQYPRDERRRFRFERDAHPSPVGRWRKPCARSCRPRPRCRHRCEAGANTSEVLEANRA